MDQNDVIQYAGKLNNHKTLLRFHQEDKIEMDDRKRVYVSTGTTTVDIGGKAKVDEDNKSPSKMIRSIHQMMCHH